MRIRVQPSTNKLNPALLPPADPVGAADIETSLGGVEGCALHKQTNPALLPPADPVGAADIETSLTYNRDHQREFTVHLPHKKGARTHAILSAVWSEQSIISAVLRPVRGRTHPGTGAGPDTYAAPKHASGHDYSGWFTSGSRGAEQLPPVRRRRDPGRGIL